MHRERSDRCPSRVVLFAGGVGGARMATGLARALPSGSLTVVVNVGDDDQFHGLRVCPDLDTVLYTVSGRVNHKQAWGVEGDTTKALEVLRGLGAKDTWMTLGDADLGLHLYRTERLHGGATLTEVTSEVARGFGLDLRVLPVSDDVAATRVNTEHGPMRFQEWFVQHRCQPRVRGVDLKDARDATASGHVVSALQAADLIVFAPSNPFLSIQPMLEIGQVTPLLRATSAPRVVVSPLINGVSVKGPLSRLMEDMGIAAGNSGIADFYGDLIDGIAIDVSDEADLSSLKERGLQVMCVSTWIARANEAETFAHQLLNHSWTRSVGVDET